MKVKVQFKKGTVINSDATPRQVYLLFNRIKNENEGELPPEEIVRQSRPKDALLHNDFDWNNKTAAEKYRKQQAQYIIRHVEVIPVDTNSPVRAYHSVPIEVVNPNPHSEQPTISVPVYKSIEDILSDPTARDQMLAKAIQDANTFRRKYSALQELAQIIRVIEKTVAQFV